jgi:hypothetical protein
MVFERIERRVAITVLFCPRPYCPDESKGANKRVARTCKATRFVDHCSNAPRKNCDHEAIVAHASRQRQPARDGR